MESVPVVIHLRVVMISSCRAAGHRIRSNGWKVTTDGCINPMHLRSAVVLQATPLLVTSFRLFTQFFLLFAEERHSVMAVFVWRWIFEQLRILVSIVRPTFVYVATYFRKSVPAGSAEAFITLPFVASSRTENNTSGSPQSELCSLQSNRTSTRFHNVKVSQFAARHRGRLV